MELTVIQSKIYEIRGAKVMLDFDLAELYQVETKNLKKAIRRNIDRFPGDFMFELTKEECNYLIDKLRFQNGSLEITHFRYAPMALTEQGVAMLSGVLNSPLAIQINIGIMRAFVQVRKILTNPIDKRVANLEQNMETMRRYIEEVFADYNDINEDTAMQLDLMNQTLAELASNQKKELRQQVRKRIGFKREEEGG